MCRRSSRKCTVMPSAPPSTASTAAATGSGSAARRTWRTVATWSMLTPSLIIAGPHARFSRQAVSRRGSRSLAVLGVREGRMFHEEQAIAIDLAYQNLDEHKRQQQVD